MRVQIDDIILLFLKSIHVDGGLLLPAHSALSLVVIRLDLLPILLEIKTFHMGATIRSDRVHNLLPGGDIHEVDDLVLDFIDPFEDVFDEEEGLVHADIRQDVFE